MGPGIKDTGVKKRRKQTFDLYLASHGAIDYSTWVYVEDTPLAHSKHA